MTNQITETSPEIQESFTIMNSISRNITVEDESCIWERKSQTNANMIKTTTTTITMDGKNE
ncbi:MAG: hypothetical protein ACI8RD_005670 [Bacillariaceae sp.]|jgi:hypothetical protein